MGDMNGLFYWLGSQKEVRAPWTNPAALNACKVSSSLPSRLEALASRALDHPEYCNGEGATISCSMQLYYGKEVNKQDGGYCKTTNI